MRAVPWAGGKGGGGAWKGGVGRRRRKTSRKWVRRSGLVWSGAGLDFWGPCLGYFVEKVLGSGSKESGGSGSR